MSKRLKLSGAAYRRLRANRKENLKNYSGSIDAFVKKAEKNNKSKWERWWTIKQKTPPITKNRNRNGRDNAAREEKRDEDPVRMEEDTVSEIEKMTLLVKESSASEGNEKNAVLMSMLKMQARQLLRMSSMMLPIGPSTVITSCSSI